MRIYKMEDIEIYSLATDIISSITNDLNNSLYSKLGGNLSVSWKTDSIFNASAQSNSRVDEPPFHIVIMYYELARQLYRDIDEYCGYIESECDKSIFDIFFASHPDYTEILPSNFSKLDYRKNMFMSALTWVFFHEIAHLNQEHGYIRSQVLKSDNQLIDECDINNSETLDGKTSAIYHTTEMAADYEAVYTCIKELIRHFKGADLEDSIGVFICALSCSIYKFHGMKSLCIDSKPKGSHPSPIVRLEHVLPHIVEFFDIAALQSILGINLSRSDLAHICERQAVTVGIFWLKKHSLKQEKLGEFLYTRTINRPGGKEYMKTIISTWDEIEPEINKNKRFDDPLALLRFTKQYRELVFETINS